MKTVLALVLVLVSNKAEELKEFTSGNNKFAASFYKEVSKNNPSNNNFIISPFSAELILALAKFGARNETAEELQNSLNLPEDEITQTAVRNLLASLKTEEYDDSYSLKTANKMYIKENYTIKEEFTKIAVEVFSSEVENIDLSQKPEASKKMNEWVERHTNNKIRNLINAEDIDDLSRIILINALYFRGYWMEPFDNATQENFRENSTEVKKVATMHKSSIYNYCENSEVDAKFLEVPITEDVSMIVVLPNDIDGLVSLEEQIGEVLLPQNCSFEVVDVKLPKFKITDRFNLKNVLKNLGIVKAFSDGADFSGISDDPLYISNAVQMAFIDVNESGVEAAAATYVEFSLRIAHFLLPPKKEFYANHPFLFYIKAKNVILFAGRVINPNR